MFYIETVKSEKSLEKLISFFKLPRLNGEFETIKLMLFQETISNENYIEIKRELDLIIKNKSDDKILSEGLFSILNKIQFQDIINFSYEQCKNYIPDRLKTYFTREEKSFEFEESIKNHVFFAIAMRYIFQSIENNPNDRYDSFNEFIRMGMYGNSFESKHEATEIPYELYRDRLKSFSKFDKYMGRYYSKEYKNNPLKYQEYLINYILMRFEMYPHIRKPVNLNDDTIYDFVNGLIDFVNDSQEKYKNISNYIVERTFGYKLTSSILTTISKSLDIPKENEKEFIKVLALLGIVPDIENISEYLKAFLDTEIYAFDLDEYGMGYCGHNNISFVGTEQVNTNNWINNIKKDIVQYALIFMPLLEQYTLYIVKQLFKEKLDSENFVMQQIQQKYNKFTKLYEQLILQSKHEIGKENEAKFKDLVTYIFKIRNLNLDLLDKFIDIEGMDGIITLDDIIKTMEYQEEKISEIIKTIEP